MKEVKDKVAIVAVTRTFTVSYESEKALKAAISALKKGSTEVWSSEGYTLRPKNTHIKAEVQAKNL